jgi:ribonuclease D
MKSHTFRAAEVRLDRKMTAEEINALPITSYQGRIELVRSHEHMLHAVRELKRDRLLGFDTETRPVFKKGVSHPVALLQLASADGVYVFQLRFCGHLEALFSLLADPETLKAGVSIADDVKGVRALLNFEPAGFVDVGDCARRRGMLHHGLRGMAALLLGVRIGKSCRTYNWALPNLRPSAIQYAATDAWVSRELYLAMQEHGCL